MPDSAVSGLNVIARLAGANRVATARETLAWIHQWNRRSGVGLQDTASSGPPDEVDLRIYGHSRDLFLVGVDLRPGVWAINIANCPLDHNGEDLTYAYPIQEVRLRVGEFVQLTADEGQTCTIERIRD